MLFHLPRALAAEPGISLEDVWSRVLSVDYRKEASERMVASARETTRYARSYHWPEFTVEGGYTVNDHEMGTKTSLFPGVNLTVPVLQRNFYFFRSGISLPLFTGGRISDGVDAAQSGEAIATAEKERMILEIKLNAAEIYLGVLKAKRYVELADKNMSTLQAHQRDVERLHREGILSKSELLTMQVMISDARQKQIKAKNALALAEAAYHRLMHHESEEEFQSPIALVELEGDFTEINLEEAFATAQQNRPELKILLEQQKALHLQASMKEKADLPQVAITGGFNGIQDRYLSAQNFWSVSAGFRWKVFDGGKTKHEAKALEEKAEALNNIYKETSSGINLQVRQAWLNRNGAMERIGAAKDEVARAEENLRITRSRFLQGLSTNTDLLDAETLLDKSYVNREDARYDLVMALLILKKMEGIL